MRTAAQTYATVLAPIALASGAGIEVARRWVCTADMAGIISPSSAFVNST